MEKSENSDTVQANGLFDIEGRIGRTRYVVTNLLAIVVMLPISMAIGNRNSGGQLLLAIVAFSVLAPTAIKRLHDIDRKGTWLWALLIPFFNIVVQLRLIFQSGTPNANQFGIRSNIKEGINERVLQPVARPWWALDKRLRLVIIASIVWMMGAYLIQDKYDENMGVVFIPAFAALALHLLVRATVDRADPVFQSAPSVGSAEPYQSDTGKIFDSIAQEFDSGILDKGLWTRLFAECDGNENQTKARYIRERAKILISQTSTQKESSLSNIEKANFLVLSEFDGQLEDGDLWTKLLNRSGGDMEKAKVNYIQIRSRQILLTQSTSNHR